MSEINEMVFVHLLTCPHRREHLKHAQKQLYFSAIALLIEVVYYAMSTIQKNPLQGHFGGSARKSAACSIIFA